MNEELARVCFDAFHQTWKHYCPTHSHAPFDEMSYQNKEVWSKVGEAALDWFLDATFDVEQGE